MKVFGSSITGTQISNANSVQTHVTSLAVDGSRNSHYSLQSVRSVSAVRVLARWPPPSHHTTAKAQAQELEIYALIDHVVLCHDLGAACALLCTKRTDPVT
jgi:hypothetical protein